MNRTVKFTHTINEIDLDCTAAYCPQSGDKQHVDLIDVKHRGLSILKVLKASIVATIEREAAWQAMAGNRADAQDARRAANHEPQARQRT